MNPLTSWRASQRCLRNDLLAPPTVTAGEVQPGEQLLLRTLICQQAQWSLVLSTNVCLSVYVCLHLALDEEEAEPRALEPYQLACHYPSIRQAVPLQTSPCCSASFTLEKLHQLETH